MDERCFRINLMDALEIENNRDFGPVLKEYDVELSGIRTERFEAFEVM